jgi:hypothetical protein
MEKTLCDEVCQWFSSGTPTSSINKTDRHDIIEILLKVALITITPSLYPNCKAGNISYTD